MNVFVTCMVYYLVNVIIVLFISLVKVCFGHIEICSMDQKCGFVLLKKFE